MSQLNQSPVEDEWIRMSSIFNIQNFCNCHPTLKPSCRTNSWDPCQQVLHLLLSRFGMFLKQLDHSGFPCELGLCSSQIWNHVKSNTLLFEIRVRCGKPTTTGFQHLCKSLSNGNMIYKYHQISSNIIKYLQSQNITFRVFLVFFCWRMISICFKTWWSRASGFFRSSTAEEAKKWGCGIQQLII